MVKFEDLLKLKLPEVHYNIGHENKRDVGHLVPCPAPCPRPDTCRTMQTPLLIADYIRVQLGKKEKLFASIPPPFVVGSLKENSRLFFFGEKSCVDISLSVAADNSKPKTLSLDEMDLQLILEGLEKFLIFNTEDQGVEMRNLPPGHPLERFQDLSVPCIIACKP